MIVFKWFILEQHRDTQDKQPCTHRPKGTLKRPINFHIFEPWAEAGVSGGNWVKQGQKNYWRIQSYVFLQLQNSVGTTT